MKVLFLCVANQERSQVARALFNELSSHESEAAGTRADLIIERTNPPSRMLKDAASNGVQYMKAQGVDISESLRKQLTEDMVRAADKVIVMAQRDTWPDYLAESGKVTIWDLPAPISLGAEAAWAVYDEIKRRVEELVQETLQ